MRIPLFRLAKRGTVDYNVSEAQKYACGGLPVLVEKRFERITTRVASGCTCLGCQATAVQRRFDFSSVVSILLRLSLRSLQKKFDNRCDHMETTLQRS